MLTTHRIERRDGLLLVIIVFIAAILRYGQAGIVEFFHDDAMLASLAQDIVAGDAWYWTGINSSVGVPNPPMSVYALLPIFALDSDPMTVIYAIMTWNVVGVALLWGLAHRYLGRTVALVAGLAYAVAPYAVLYSRKIWAQDYHTPFVLIGFGLALLGFAEKKSRPWAQAIALPVLLFAFQIHFAAWALLPAYIVIVLMGRKQIDWRALGISVILGALTLVPYAIGLTQALQANPARLTEAFATSSASGSISLTLAPVVSLFELVTGYGMANILAPAQTSTMNQAVPPVSLWWILFGLMLIGIGLLYRQRYRPLAPFLLVWAFLPAFALITGVTDVHNHYFITSIPALILLVAIATDQISRIVPLQPRGQSIVLIAVAVILLTQSIYWRGVLRYVDRTPIAYPGFTIPLHDLQTIADDLATFDDVVVLSDGMAWDLHHESVVWDVLLQDDVRCVRTLTGDGYAVQPVQAFAVLQTPAMPGAGVGRLYRNDRAQAHATRGASETYTRYAWSESPPIAADVIPIAPVTFDSGVQLTGYKFEETRLILAWDLPERRAGLDYQYSSQLFTATGERIAQHDTRFWHGRHWCAGDRLLTWVTLSTPADASELRVSLYQLGTGDQPSFVNANIVDELGNPQGQYATIPLSDEGGE